MNELCVCSEPVAQALAARAPVVALETTVVTHGLPHPDGIAAALALEDEVRQSGATPATIGVLRGAIRIGISREELDELATTPDVCKTNLSNLAAVVASGGLGSTTVAATMWAAHMNGIRVFATGGIGGVHRGADETGDVSSDLTALGRVPVAVVCAGAKAILDLPRTVEMLETLGVPILGLVRRSDSLNWPSAWRPTTFQPSTGDRAGSAWIVASIRSRTLPRPSTHTSGLVSARVCLSRIPSRVLPKCHSTCTTRRFRPRWPI